MHAKTARSVLTKLRSEVRSKYDPETSIALSFEQAIADQLAFHNKYGGKIYAVGRINGTPETDDIDPEIHFKSRVFCLIDDLFLLDHPIDISEFNSFITISRQSGITPVYSNRYDKLKELISRNNNIREYF